MTNNCVITFSCSFSSKRIQSIDYVLNRSKALMILKPSMLLMALGAVDRGGEATGP